MRAYVRHEDGRVEPIQITLRWTQRTTIAAIVLIYLFVAAMGVYMWLGYPKH